MDGLLVVDKPAGPTSHDVVSRVRRLLGERAIGHTGTLDPMATGVLPLVLGRATRLARFLSASDKTYDATITLGVSTDSADAAGAAIGLPYEGAMPSRDVVDRALDAFRGSFLQQPPAYSAKKIGGTRSYKLARAAASPLRPRSVPAPSLLRPSSVPVVVHALELVGVDRNQVTLLVHCSAGFYVRALAHDLGAALGTGAHLSALRRTRSGEWALPDAIALDDAEREPARAVAHIVPMARMLTHVPAVVLTPEGVRHALHGRNVGVGEIQSAAGFGIRDSGSGGDSGFEVAGFGRRSGFGAESRFGSEAGSGSEAGFATLAHVRLMDADGNLVAIAEPVGAGALLHPFVVLM
jgi:tRNA pseudouridine55 synthase